MQSSARPKVRLYSFCSRTLLIRFESLMSWSMTCVGPIKQSVFARNKETCMKIGHHISSIKQQLQQQVENIESEMRWTIFYISFCFCISLC